MQTQYIKTQDPVEEEQDQLIEQYYTAYETHDTTTMKWLEFKLQLVGVEVKYI